jgi:PPP family 3-phenylpropionic acid transporter
MLFIKLSLFYFFYFATVGVYVIFLPKVLNDIGYSTADIGILLALAPLMRFLTPFLFLKHIQLNQTFFKYILLLSIISSMLFYVTINNFYLFMINNAILGISLAIILPYVELITIRELKDNYGKSRLFGSVGFMLIGLVLANYLTSPQIALHYYLIATILTGVTAFSVLKYDNQPHLENKGSDKFSLLKYWQFWLSLFLMQVSFGGFYNFFTIYESSYGIDLETISYLWAFGVVAEILMFYFQAPLLKYNLLVIIRFSILVVALRWFLLFLYPESLTISFFTQSLHAVSFGLYHTAIVLYLYKIYSNKKLAQQFMLGIAYGLGGFVGAVISGWSYGEYLFLYSSIIALLGFVTLLFFKPIHLGLQFNRDIK